MANLNDKDMSHEQGIQPDILLMGTKRVHFDVGTDQQPSFVEVALPTAGERGVFIEDTQRGNKTTHRLTDFGKELAERNWQAIIINEDNLEQTRQRVADTLARLQLNPDYRGDFLGLMRKSFETRIKNLEAKQTLKEIGTKGSPWRLVADSLMEVTTTDRTTVENRMIGFVQKTKKETEELAREIAVEFPNRDKEELQATLEKQTAEVIAQYLLTKKPEEYLKVKDSKEIDRLTERALLWRLDQMQTSGQINRSLREDLEKKYGIIWTRRRFVIAAAAGTLALGAGGLTALLLSQNTPKVHAASTPDYTPPAPTEAATQTPTPEPTGTPEPTETSAPVDPLAEKLKNPDFRVGPISLENDLTIIFPEQTTKLAGLEGELKFDLNLKPIYEHTEPEIPQDTYDQFNDYNRNGGMGLVFRTDRPRNNFILGHSVRDDKGNILPLEVINLLAQLDPETARKAYYFIEQVQDGKIVRVRMNGVDIQVNNEQDLRISMATFSDPSSPVVYWTDTPNLQLPEEARRADVLGLVACTGKLERGSIAGYNKRVIFSASLGSVEELARQNANAGN